MLRALSLAILIIASSPTLAIEASDETVVAQQQKPAPQSTPKRDCERNQDGIS